jgi:hypothetical protein
MDILAHALWAGAGVTLAQRRWPVSPRTAALTVALAVAPDLPHALPILAWSALGAGTSAAVADYANALPGLEPALPEAVQFLSHHLHCIGHSAVIAGVITALAWAWRRSLWIPLLGWWSHIVIDVVTHSLDYYPSPVLYPITRQGFDGVAWNAPWFMALNYAALAAIYAWLFWTRRTRASDSTAAPP